MYEARIAKGLTIEQVEKALKVSRSTISQAEATGTKTGRLLEFADLYEVSPRWLATGEGERTRTAEAVALVDKEARELAALVDKIVTSDPDPVRREWAIQLMRLAVGSPPVGQVGILDVAKQLAEALQATRPHERAT